MFAKERYTKILEMLKETGSVTTAQLVNAFSVSIETIRRDLLILEESGMLQRVHGGAVAMGDMIAFRELPQRMQENVTQKRELCRTAMDFIKNGDTIGVDSGSTAVLFAEALKEHFSDLTIITYSLDCCVPSARHFRSRIRGTDHAADAAADRQSGICFGRQQQI